MTETPAITKGPPPDTVYVYRTNEYICIQDGRQSLMLDIDEFRTMVKIAEEVAKEIEDNPLK